MNPNVQGVDTPLPMKETTVENASAKMTVTSTEILMADATAELDDLRCFNCGAPVDLPINAGLPICQRCNRERSIGLQYAAEQDAAGVGVNYPIVTDPEICMD